MLLNAGGDLRAKSRNGMTPFRYRRACSDVEHLRPIYEAWTPHRMLPRWTPAAFLLYTERCDGFRDAVMTLLLCLLRYRRIIPPEVGMVIVEYVAEMHRNEMWWPAWEDFDMQEYM